MDNVKRELFNQIEKLNLEEDWARGTLKEAPFWRDGMTPEEYDEENIYLQRHWDEYMNNTYVPLWKQKEL